MNPVFSGLPTTVFETMSRLAREHGAINLGQGFPDDPGPADLRERGARALVEGSNQYPPMMGLPALRAAVAAHYARHQGLALDPETEVMVTSGATEAIAGALLALIEPGDEVVLFAPMYDAYLPLVRRAGGVPRIVVVKPRDSMASRPVREVCASPIGTARMKPNSPAQNIRMSVRQRPSASSGRYLGSQAKSMRRTYASAGMPRRSRRSSSRMTTLEPSVMTR